MTCDSRRQPCRLKAQLAPGVWLGASSWQFTRHTTSALVSLSAQQACYLQLAPRPVQSVMRSCLYQYVSGPPGSTMSCQREMLQCPWTHDQQVRQHLSCRPLHRPSEWC